MSHEIQFLLSITPAPANRVAERQFLNIPLTMY